MLTTNDAYLYRFQAKIINLDLRFKPNKPMSVVWHKDQKIAETQKSLHFESNSVIFKDNTSQKLIGCFYPQDCKQLKTQTTFTIYQHDFNSKKEIGSAKFKITQVLQMKLNSYNLEIVNEKNLKGYINFNVSQKFVMKVSEFKFNKQPDASQSQQSSLYQHETSIGFERKHERNASLDLDQGKSHRILRDQADMSLYQQNKRLKTDHDRLAMKTRQAQAKTKRSQKVVWWQFKQMTDFYNKKLRIHKKIYQDSIQKIVFQTNESKDRYNQIIDQMQLRIYNLAQKQQLGFIELNKCKQQLSRLKQQYEIDIMKQKQYQQLQKVQYTNKSSQLIRTYEIRIKQLQKLLHENINKVQKYQDQINKKSQSISKLTGLNNEINKNNQQQVTYLKSQVQSIQSRVSLQQNQYQKLQIQLRQFTSILDSADFRFYQSSIEGKLKSLLNHYKSQSLTITQLTNELANKNNQVFSQSQFKDELQTIKHRLQQKQKIIINFKSRDEMGQKNIQSLQSLLDYQKQSNLLYSTKLQKQVNQSEVIRRQLRTKQLELIEKDQLIQQINSKFLTMEQQLMQINTEKQNLEEENQHLHSLIKSMDGIVSSKPIRTEGLIEELHQEIRKKNNNILELEKRYNKLISVLSECKDAGADLEKVIQLILNDDIQQIDYVLEHSRKKAVEVLFRQQIQQIVQEQIQHHHFIPRLEFSVQNSPRFSKIRKSQHQTLDDYYQRFVNFVQNVSAHQQKLNKLSQKPEYHLQLKEQIQQSHISKDFVRLCTDLQQVKNDTANILIRLEEERNQVFTENQKLKADIFDINKEVQQLLEGKKTAKKHSRELNDRQKELKELTQAGNLLNIQLQKSKQRIKQLQMKLDHSILQYQRLERQNQSLQQTYQSQLLQKQRNQQKKINQNEQLKRSLQISYQNISNLQHDISQKTYSIQDMNKRYSSLQNEHKQLIVFTKQFQQNLHKAFDESKRQTQKYQSRQSILQNQISELRTTLSKSKVQISLLQQDLKTKTHNYYKQTQNLKTLVLQRDQELKLQYKSLEEYKRIEIEDDKKIRNLEIKIRDIISGDQNNKQDSLRKLNVLTKQLSILKEQRSIFEEQNKLNKIKYLQQCQRNSILQKQLYECQQKYNDIKRMHELSQLELKKKLEDVQNLLSDVKNTKSTVEAKRNQNIELLEQLKRKDCQVQQLRKIVGVNQQILLSLQRELDLVKKQNIETKKQVNSIQQQNKKSKEKLEKQIQELQYKLNQSQYQISERDLYIEQLKRSISLQTKSHTKSNEQLLFDFQMKQKQLQTQLSQVITKQLQQTKSMQLKNNQIRRNEQTIFQLKQLLNNKQVQADTMLRQNNQLLNSLKNLKDGERFYSSELQNYQKVLDIARRREMDIERQLDLERKKVNQCKQQLEQQITNGQQKLKLSQNLNKKIGQLETAIRDKQTQLLLKQKSFKLDFNKSCAQHQSALKKQQTEHAAYRLQHKYNNMQYEQILQSNKRMQIQISQSNDKINRLEKQHVIDVNDIKVSYAKKDQQKSAIIDIQVSQMSQQIHSLKNQLKNYKEQNHIAHENNLKLQTSCQQLNKQIEQLQKQSTNKQHQLQNTINLKDEQIYIFKEQISSINSIIKQLKHNIQIKEEQISSLKNILRELQFNSDQIAQFKKKNVALSKQITNLQQSLYKERQSYALTEESLRTKYTTLEQKYWKQVTAVNKQLITKQEEIKHYFQITKEKEQYIQNLINKIEYLETMLKNGGDRQRGGDAKEVREGRQIREGRRLETVPSHLYR